MAETKGQHLRGKYVRGGKNNDRNVDYIVRLHWKERTHATSMKHLYVDFHLLESVRPKKDMKKEK